MEIVKQRQLAVVTCPEQRYDLGHWTEFLGELDQLKCPVVVDVRAIDGGLSEIDAYLLALQAEEMPHLKRHRLALITSGDPQCYAAFFAICGQNRGLDIEVFTCVESARRWAGSHPGQPEASAVRRNSADRHDAGH